MALFRQDLARHRIKHSFEAQCLRLWAPTVLNWSAHRHINPYGKIDFDIPKTKAMKGLRQLRPIKIPEN